MNQGDTAPKKQSPAWTTSPRVADHIIQGVMIFASVFLAFWLNDYRLAVGERRATQAAVEAVAREVATNLAILERWAPYHRDMSEAVMARLAAGPGAPAEFRPSDFMDERGIFREILTHDSWEVLRQTEVRLDLDTRLAVNRIFRQQEYVDHAIRQTVDFLDTREVLDAERAEENHLIFYRLVTDLYYQQVALKENYRRLLASLEAS